MPQDCQRGSKGYSIYDLDKLDKHLQNLKDNYNQVINLKRKDQLKTKDDVPIAEAFELYMLKKFHNIKLNSLTNNMLNFWEKDFENSIEKHREFLMNNLDYFYVTKNENDFQ